MKKSQRFVVIFDSIRVICRYDDLGELRSLADELAEDTVSWRKEFGSGQPAAVARVIDGICVSMTWEGLPPSNLK